MADRDLTDTSGDDSPNNKNINKGVINFAAEVIVNSRTFGRLLTTATVGTGLSAALIFAGLVWSVDPFFMREGRLWGWWL